MPDWKQEISRRLADWELAPAREAAVIEELSQHLEDRYEELLAGGAMPEEAYRATLAEVRESQLFAGGLRRVERLASREPVVLGTDERRNMLADMWQDLRYGLRMMRKNPGFTVIAALTLGLGIGAGTAIFSAINALLLRPLPLEDVERLVYGATMREGFDPFRVSLLDYAAIRRRSHSFTGIGLGASRHFNLIERGEPERIHGAAVMADYLSTLGVRPALGRIFTAEEDRPNGPMVALLGYGLWQRRFGGDRNLVGQSLSLEGHSYTIVGVMPPGFNLPYGAEIWTPLQTVADGLPLQQSAARGHAMVARLRSGVSVEQSDAELKAIARQLEQEYPQTHRGWGFKVISLRRELIDDLDGRVHRSLVALAAAVGFLLLIACVNVASLLLARGVAREGEVAIRQSLGASAWRVARQFFAENLLLAAAGGVVGLSIAWQALPLLSAHNPIQTVTLAAYLRDLRIDGRVLGFTLLMTLLTALIFGIIPAIRAVRTRSLAAVMKHREQRSGGDASGRRLLGALVVVELALAVTLLVGGGLLIQSFQKLQAIDPGFRPENLLAMQMTLSPNKYPNHEQRVAYIERVLHGVKALPGVISTGTTTNLPLDTDTFDSQFAIEGRAPANPAEVPMTAHRLVSGDYLATLGVTLLKGRLLNEQDRAGSQPVVVISEELARQAWPGEDPLGKRLMRSRANQPSGQWMTVVGVVKDTKEDRFNFRIDRPAWYLPYAQHDASLPVNLVVRGDSANLAAAVRAVVRRLDPEQPVDSATTINERLVDVVATERFSAILMGLLAALGLLLAALGLYGVMAWAVSRRTGEIGLRMALGAQPRDVLKLVIGEGAALIVAGLAGGLAGALILSRLLAGTLYGVSAHDPLTFIVVALLLAGVALLACWVPARRATKVDPLVALRPE
jgi:putative ABC transport system permease protein